MSLGQEYDDNTEYEKLQKQSLEYDKKVREMAAKNDPLAKKLVERAQN